MNPTLLRYRRVLCEAFGGLDQAEREMVRRLIAKIDARRGMQ
jgi:hypothetical protein